MPGTLSALGAAQANLEGDFVQPVYRDLGDLDAATLRDTFDGIRKQSGAWLEREAAGLEVQYAVVEYSAEMRYEGQGYDVGVSLEEEWLAEGAFGAIRDAFHQAHERAFGHRHDDAPVWLQELRAHVAGHLPKPAPAAAAVAATAGEPSTRTIRLRGTEVAARIFSREQIAADSRIDGPAIIEQMDTTTLVPDGWALTLANNGAMIVTRDGAQ